MPKTLDSRLTLEKYMIVSKRSSKCWIYLGIEDGGKPFRLHRADINTGLVARVVGHEVDVIRRSDPEGTNYLAGILYKDEFLYPRKNKIETARYHRTGLL
jgi:hypothetical protein